MSVSTTCPEAAYLTKPNIVVPEYLSPEAIAAAEDRARVEIGERRGDTTVSGGIIEQAL
jgi:hypothetical protein